MNEHSSPEFEKEIRETLRVPDADPAFVRNLRATIIERSMMKTQTRSSPRLAWGLVIAILLVGLLIASPRVAEALKQLLGYVPGVGYVQQGNSLRVLSAPVTVDKDGVKVTIEKGAADSQRTVLLEYVEGVTPDPLGERYCDTPARLVLPDGTVLKEMGYETSQEGGKGSLSGSYFGRYDFEAMPVGQLEATLEIPCVMHNFNYKDWKLPLHFQLADGTQVAAVIELPTEAPPPPSGAIQTAPTPAHTPLAESTIEGFSIVLESETPLADGYILAGSYQWTDARFDGTSVQPNDPKITDANGQMVEFDPVSPPALADPSGKKLPFAYQIKGNDYAWPLLLTVNSINVNLPDQGTFQFDAGANPQVGQVWDVNIDVPVAEHIIHIQTIKLTAGRTPTQLGFDFTMTSDSGVMGASITDANPILNDIGGGGGGGGGGDSGSSVGPFTYGWAIEGYSPAGIKTFVVSGLSVTFHGTWKAIWWPFIK
jgi:hypothetical protein